MQMGKSKFRSLDDVFNDPDAARILTLPKKVRHIINDPDIQKFQEIQHWVKINKREPQKSKVDLQERKYASALKGMRENPERREKLLKYDKLSLLKNKTKEKNLQQQLKNESKTFNSLDEILNDDSVLFSKTDSQALNDSKLFNTHKLKAIKKKHLPEKISYRKKMDSFVKYEPLFKKVQAELAAGKRKLLPFKNYDINQHNFYILNGQLLYVESIGDAYIRKVKDAHKKRDARIHIIYENGTENYPLLNGLGASLYGRKGKIVTEPDESFKLTNDDQVTGYIYILESLSKSPEVLRIKEEHSLYKVGVTANSIEKRIANAENESTYLYAPVKIREEINVINLNPVSLETAIHHALVNYQLNVDIKAPNGKIIHPREWFAVDMETINTLINKIVAKLQMELTAT